MKFWAAAFMAFGFMSQSSLAQQDDLYLEEVRGERALQWVHEQNALSAEVLEKDPRFEPMRAQTRTVLDAKDRLTAMSVRNGYVYDIWRDAKNPRGVYRRVKLAEYMAGGRNWDVILDFDKLAQDEKENWVYKGGTAFKNRVMVFLSRGGGDATVDREFDLETRQFVTENSFQLPEGKHDLSWYDEDTLILGLARAGEVTKAGYPSKLRLWKRGTAPEKAPVIHSGEHKDVFVGGAPIRDKVDEPAKGILLYRYTDFFNKTYRLYRDGRTDDITLPTDADLGISEDLMYILLKSPWEFQGHTYISGSLVRAPLNEFLNGEAGLELLFTPSESSFLATFTAMNGRVFLGLNEHVSQNWVELKRQKNGHYSRERIDLPANSAVALASASDEDDIIVFEATGFLQPTSRYVLNVVTDELKMIEQAPPRFDASPYKVEQNFAVSRDGTRVPYYVVAHKDLVLNGKNPTIISAYGGFEVSRTPSYSASVGLSWLAEGGVWVVANIRGGGEYGPAWHKAALQENRQRAFDDLFAVTEDLHRLKISSPRHTGAVGGSNGGLLMGVALTQRPDLYNAIAIQVPLLDMLRYHLLLAGDSWVGEYGHPDDPKMRPILEGYSPYHNLHADRAYPVPFIMTSTADDRVHPGHARRFGAKMQELGLPFMYYENTEGGHGGSANNAQSAHWSALQFTYFLQKLK